VRAARTEALRLGLGLDGRGGGTLVALAPIGTVAAITPLAALAAALGATTPALTAALGATPALAAAVVAATAVAGPPVAALVAPPAVAVAALASLASFAAIAVSAPATTAFAAAAAGELGGDELVVATRRRPHDLEAVRLAPRRPRGHDGRHLDTVEVPLDLDAQHVAH